MATSTEIAPDRQGQTASKSPPPSRQDPIEPNVTTDETGIELQPLGTAAEPESTAEIDDTVYPTGAKFYLSSLGLIFALLLGSLDANIVATAVPAITDHFHTVADVGWYYTAYRLCSSALQFVFGKLYKTFSVKRVFLTSIGIFLVGSVFCAAAKTSAMFVLGRAITGLGASGIIAGCFTLLAHLIPLRKRPVYMGVFGAFESIAVIAAPILGGVLTQKLSWRWCFWINLPVGGLALVMITLLLSDPPRGENLTWRQAIRELDLVGNLVFLPSLACLFIALSWAGTKYPWNDPKIIGLLATFAALLGIFIYSQLKKGDSATLPPRILKNRNVIAGFVFSCCISSSLNIMEYYMPTYFQVVRGYSPAQSGYMMIPILIGTMLAILIQGSGTSIIGYYTPFMILTSLLMPVGVGLVTTWTVDTQLDRLIFYSGMVGFGAGLGFLGPQTSVQTTLRKDDVPLGLAVILFAQGFGPALFVSLAQTVFTARLSHNLHDLAPNLNATDIEKMGLTQLKTSLGPANLEKVVLGFSESLSQTWYLAVGLTCVTIVASLATEWRSVKQKRS